MIKGSLGIGLFAMPLAFKHSGILTGIIGTILICCVVWHCMHIFVRGFLLLLYTFLFILLSIPLFYCKVKTSLNVCIKRRLRLIGYSKTVEIVVDMGPRPLAKYANFIR